MLNLKNIMRANAVSCLVFGVLFTLQANLVATFLGGELAAPPLYLLILGILLVVNGLHLVWASRIPLPKKHLILYFSVGDCLWVIASVALMLAEVWITTIGGILTTSAVAILVGVFGVLQMTSRKAMGHC
ncbi:hypothetical protein [Marinomonas transparens]|uniref:Uncharacterized protein n=1 Tax=Marinomonas transparens TaxID=2795388 RepID=A0A934N129_9GAMM|nr:hypothetical protein [Marinomonas transparens]MBJ7539125.1 hypothetical protein [Marinomonas transparens]